MRHHPCSGCQKAILLVDPDAGEKVTTTHRSSYSVTFSDLGADILITAPEGALRVEGEANRRSFRGSRV